MFDIFHAWHEMAVKLKNGEITKDEYDTWRYNFPAMDSTVIKSKIPSEEIVDAIVKDK